MEIRRHRSCNHSYDAPPDMTSEECATLPVWLTEDPSGAWAHSFWKPSTIELSALQSGGSIVLSIRLGEGGHPVVMVQATDDLTEAV